MLNPIQEAKGASLTVMLTITCRKTLSKAESSFYFILFQARISEENSDSAPQPLKREYWWTKIKHKNKYTDWIGKKNTEDFFINSEKIIAWFIKKKKCKAVVTVCISPRDE